MTSEKRVQKFHTDDWWNLLHPIRSTTQIWVVMCHQYAISVLNSQTSFRRKTIGVVIKCHLFSLATPKGVMSQGYYFFRSILYWSHYLVPLPIHKMQLRIQGRGLGGPPPLISGSEWHLPPPLLSEGLDPPLKCSCRVMEKIPNKFLQGALTIILIFFGDFCKFESMSILSIWQQTTRNSFNA